MAIHELPIVHTCDVAIAGGGAGAAATAVALRALGLRVLIAAPGAYVGDDVVGDVRLWCDAAAARDGLAAAVFADARGAIARAPTPLHAKRALEQALVAADATLLLGTRAVGLVRDGAGAVAGIVVADRAGLQVVRARAVVDAGARALVGDAAGCARLPWTTTVAVRRALVGPRAPAIDGAAVARIGELAVPEPDGRVVEVPAWEARWMAPCASAAAADLAALDQATALACWRSDAVLASERVEVAWPDRFVGLDADGRAGSLALWIAGPCAAPLEPAAALARAPRLARAIALALRDAAPTRGELSVSWPAAAGRVAGEARAPTGGLRAGDARGERVVVDLATLPTLAAVDVVVAGGGTAGAPAAIAAARAGARTIALEAMPALGGVGTLGQICRYWFGNRVGFTVEVDAGWPALGADSPALLERCVRTDAWHPEWKARWYLERLAAAGGAAWFGWATVGAVVDGGRVAGVVAAGPWGVGTLAAGCCVDASGSADVAAAAGAEVETIGAEHVAVQGTGLGPRDPGRHYRNTDHTFVDDNDVADATRAHLASRLAFADAFDVGQLIDTRERRRIRGDVVIRPEDVVRDRRWRDAIARATSNFDTHGFTVHPLFLVEPMREDPLWCDVPLRALLPRGLDGVLVTGLGISAHRDALPVVRMQPDVQNHGYAAGRAAAMAARLGGRVRAIDVRALQRHLVDLGALPARALVERDEREPDAQDAAWAARDGLDLHLGLAICFAVPELAAPELRAALADPARERRAALVLGLCGDGAAAAALARRVREAAWDDGWDFRGMGQFGRSASDVDALVIALGACGGADAVPALADKAAQLALKPQFSHCRALGEAVRRLVARGVDVRALAAPLAVVLSADGVGGHAQRDVATVQRRQTTDPTENAARDRSLRELTLAAALVRCGDADGLGRATMHAYVDDLRGHYRRHALAVLAEVAATMRAARA